MTDLFPEVREATIVLPGDSDYSVLSPSGFTLSSSPLTDRNGLLSPVRTLRGSTEIIAGTMWLLLSYPK